MIVFIQARSKKIIMGQCISRGDRFRNSETDRSVGQGRRGSARSRNLIGIGKNPGDWKDSSSSHDYAQRNETIAETYAIMRKQEMEISNLENLHRSRLESQSEEHRDTLVFTHGQKLQETVRRQLETLESYTDNAETRIRREKVQEILKTSRKEMQRLRFIRVAQHLGLNAEDIPDYESQEWSGFVCNKFDEIVKNKSLIGEDAKMLTDIVYGGINDKYTIDERNSDRYKEIFKFVLEEWKNR